MFTIFLKFFVQLLFEILIFQLQHLEVIYIWRHIKKLMGQLCWIINQSKFMNDFKFKNLHIQTICLLENYVLFIICKLMMSCLMLSSHCILYEYVSYFNINIFAVSQVLKMPATVLSTAKIFLLVNLKIGCHCQHQIYTTNMKEN